ncbi:ArsR/SmtB family transcription factor [Rhizohabitans arisaemae]|uniref:ArsR/SmtB family transcription factor n=1 Tax=Rhizohabitans arisaemae TaxID=2720610 RepID=UPI0024B24B19|nr:DUF5937 family protein [Rhizohabitans arisaemae]
MPAETVVSEFRRTLADQRDPAARALIEKLLEDPAASRDQLVDLCARCWKLLIHPYWGRIRRLLEADIAHRARTLTEYGLARVFTDINKKLTYQDGILSLSDHYVRERLVGGVGVVLLPSVFIWPSTAVISASPWQPTISYPVRGVGDLWRQPSAGSPEALERLIGRTRAMILAGLDRPTSTTTLAEQYGLSPSGVSAHLTALRDAGLVSSRRDRHQVLYFRTPLGDALLQR